MVESTLAQAPVVAAELESHRADLTAYCYRMLGSPFDAEDAVQDTILRAWRNVDRFQGRAAVRTWLYRIATNVCLDMLKGKQRRVRAMHLGQAGEPLAANLRIDPRVRWIEPIPDSLIATDPADIAISRESVRLALIAAMQCLPGRQRAALIMRDVLGWDAAEIAELLETSAAAVNSALQRARATLARSDFGAADTEPIASVAEPQPAVSASDSAKSLSASDSRAASVSDSPKSSSASDSAKSSSASGSARSSSASDSAKSLSASDRRLLERYVVAFERYDLAGLTEVIREDARQSMPPYDLWLRGRDDIFAWWWGPGIGCRGSRMLPTVGANGCPAFGQYKPEPDGGWTPWALQVVELAHGRIVELTFFLDTARLFPLFGLPARLDL